MVHSLYNNNNGNQTVQQYASPLPLLIVCKSFFIKFTVGNINVCYGCQNRYSKSPKPPDDTCLQTEVWKQFTPAGRLLPQTRWSDTYYYLHVNCAFEMAYI